MDNSMTGDAVRKLHQLEARIAHQKLLAAELNRQGFKGAAAQALTLLATLQGRLGRDRCNTPLHAQETTSATQ